MALIVALVILAIGMMFDLPLLTIIGGAAVLWIGFVRLAYRWPLVAIMLVGFLRGLFGARR